VTEPRTITASRSYQYDVATVNTDDQEQKYLNQVIVDDVAQQIVRQISSNRLPKVVTKPANSTTQP
jgi:LPS-assembly lipoprotein